MFKKMFSVILAVLLLALPAIAAETYIQLPADSTGKKSRTMNQTIGGNDVHSSVGVIGDGDTDSTQEVNTDQTASMRLKSSATVIVTNTTPLANGASYTTPTFDTALNGAGLTFLFTADQSAYLEFLESIDDTTYITVDPAPYPGANYPFHEMHVGHARYWKVKVTNDSGSAMTSMSLQAIQRHIGVPWKIKIDEMGNSVTQGSDIPWSMEGAKTNNFAVPGAANIGTLPAIATTSAPTYTTGNQVALSTNTTGSLRVTLDGETVPVTGTFWQATQPVSGTFWQATQPVSGTVTATSGTAANLKAEVVGIAADNSAAATNNISTLPGIVETSTTPPTRTDGNRAALTLDSDGKAYVRTFDWDPLFVTSGLSTATTLTQLIAAPGASVSVYITGWKCSASVAATATADQQCTIKYGTGTNCGTGTTYVDGCFQIANGGCAESMTNPLKLPANVALCWVHAATGSKIVRVNYFLAP